MLRTVLPMPKKSLSELVLDSIDVISARKNRPNLIRIFRHLNKLYDLSLQTCEHLIQNLLDEGLVVKVTYKGHISYRNALKWKKYNYFLKKNMRTELPGTFLTDAISELVCEEPDYLNIGVPYNILEEHIISMQENISRETIQKLVNRELELKSLCQYENGNYFLGPKPPDAQSTFFVEKPKLDISKSAEVNKPEASVIVKDQNNQIEINVSYPMGRIPEEDLSFNSTHKTYNNNIKEVSFIHNGVEKEEELDIKMEIESPIKVSNGKPTKVNVMIDKLDVKGSSLTKSISKLQDCESPSGTLLIEEDIVKTKNFIDVGKIVSSSDNLELDYSSANSQESSYSKTNEDSSPAKELSEDEKEHIEPINSLVLERGKRKKKIKFDACDFYYPTLKRKSRELETDKDEKPSRYKKKKKTENLPKVSFSKRVMFPGNTSMCCECMCYKSKVKLDPMIYCSSCSNQGHQSCAGKKMEGKNYYCVNCREESKVCWVCEMPDEEGTGGLYECSNCQKPYHKDCHVPRIPSPFVNSWSCGNCSPPIEKNHSKDKLKGLYHLPSSLKTFKKSINSFENKATSSHEYFEGEPPDTTKWTSRDIYNYFKKYFNERIARSLYDQDLDGYSLRLVGKEDILKLNFLLGDSLKILMHIKRLQLRTNSLNKIWSS